MQRDSEQRPKRLMIMKPTKPLALALIVTATLSLAARQPRTLVLDNVKIVDGTGAAPVERGRIVIQGERITRIGAVDKVQAPSGAETIDLAGRTVIPGLIDSHFHIEREPKMALRQLSHGFTAFRNPGQWNVRFDELR